ncbi:unnamed protein product, partial [Iphiclides podalirius]
MTIAGILQKPLCASVSGRCLSDQPQNLCGSPGVVMSAEVRPRRTRAARSMSSRRARRASLTTMVRGRGDAAARGAPARLRRERPTRSANTTSRCRQFGDFQIVMQTLVQLSVMVFSSFFSTLPGDFASRFYVRF